LAFHSATASGGWLLVVEQSHPKELNPIEIYFATSITGRIFFYEPIAEIYM
jgi:hypothetical protein